MHGLGYVMDGLVSFRWATLIRRSCGDGGVCVSWTGPKYYEVTKNAKGKFNYIVWFLIRT